MTRHLPYNRADRVADGIYRLVSEIVLTELSDPRLKDIHITRVAMTGDLKVARVYFHFANGEKILSDKAIEGFESSKGFLKRRIAKELALKYTPEIQFYYDDSVDLREKIESLFN